MVCSFAFDWVLDFRKNSVGILYWPCIRQGNLLELPSGTWFSMEIAFMMKMDEKDRLIVRLLREDARMPVSELSKRVGLSGPSTGDRMRRLEANGIISRFTVDLDLEALGYPLQAIVRIKPRPGNMHVVEDMIMNEPGFVDCDKVTGEDCFVTRLVLRSIAELDPVLLPFHDRAETNTAIIKSSPLRSRIPV
jgi:Lrp/AsnC family leucine-responsive transcriptional regulator